MPEHFVDGCTCTPSGEHPDCPHHGYEAVIWRLTVENERLSRALDAVTSTAGETDA